MTERQFHSALIALGSNLNSPNEQVEKALETLSKTPGIQVRARSPLFETEPVGYADQPWFVNAVCWIETMLEPHVLLDTLMGIERQMGRTRDPEIRFGPRIIDLDLLGYNTLNIQNDLLSIPHPRMHERAFVLEPLHALCSDYPELLSWVNQLLPEALDTCLEKIKTDTTVLTA